MSQGEGQVPRSRRYHPTDRLVARMYEALRPYQQMLKPSAYNKLANAMRCILIDATKIDRGQRLHLVIPAGWDGEDIKALRKSMQGTKMAHQASGHMQPRTSSPRSPMMPEIPMKDIGD